MFVFFNCKMFHSIIKFSLYNYRENRLKESWIIGLTLSLKQRNWICLVSYDLITENSQRIFLVKQISICNVDFSNSICKMHDLHFKVPCRDQSFYLLAMTKIFQSVQCESETMSCHSNMHNGCWEKHFYITNHLTCEHRLSSENMRGENLLSFVRCAALLSSFRMKDSPLSSVADISHIFHGEQRREEIKLHLILRRSPSPF